MDEITIGVTEFVNNILVSAQPNDQTIDITVTETVETVLLDVSTTVQEVTVTATQNVIVENITVDYVNNENNIDINVTDGTQDVTLNITPTLVEINILRSGGEVNILQFNTLADFPATGSSDYFYLAKDTNKLYRWTGSAYAEISATSSPVWGQIIGTLSNQTDLQNALNLKAPINSPTFTGTVSGITKAMVGLGQVDNTSDLDKPISTATQTALNNKQPLDGDLTSIAALSGTFGLLKKTANNSYTIDTNTYLTGITSGDVTTALGYTPENVANKGANNGYASLGGDGKVPSSQLPSYVDDVIEVSSFGTLPATGETGKIYITLDTNKIYRWSGSVYVEVSSSAAVWGGITGTLSNQTDLQTALDAKQDDLNGTGFVKSNAGTISYDNTSYYPASNPNGYTSNVGTVTSVALTVPSAFSVSGSPITSSGTLAVTATGDTTQYIAGDGSLVTFPTIGTAGTLTREVRNTTGATLTKGTVVYISGATGNKPTVSKALATGDSTSAQTFGLVQANIANNANGNVVCVGDLTGLDTSAFTEGAQLYLSSTTAGTYTTTKQLAPNHLVYIGVVTRAHPTQGQIEVNIQNGYELYELHDVSITSEANNQGLFYEASTDLWKNKSIATVLGYTPANGADYMALTGDQSIAGNKTFTGFAYFDNTIFLKQTTSISFISGYNSISASSSGIRMGITSGISALFDLTSLSTNRDYTLPNASGTLALTSDLHNAVTIGTANGLSLSTQVLSLALASTSATGALSSTDWNTFNNKASTASLANYLPLAGGTLTGALNGTSGTFTGNVSTTAQLRIESSGNAILLVGSRTGQTVFEIYNASNVLRFYNGTNEALKIDTGAGAATFSSSVTANQLAIQTTPLSGVAVTILGNATNAVPIALINRNSTKRFDFILDVNAVDDKGFGIYDRTNGAYRFVLSDAGNVGIGTSSPSRILSISQTNPYISLTSTSNSREFLVGVDSSGYVVYDATAGTYRMAINSAGNIGIGTTSPTTYSLAGRHLELNDAGGGYSFIHCNTTSVKSFYATNESAGLTALFTFSNHALTFGTNNTERMRITTLGTVGINTTYSNSVYKLVAKTGTNVNIAFGIQDGEASIESFNDAVSAGTPLRIYHSKLSLLGGNVGIGTTAPASPLSLSGTSDIGMRIKAGSASLCYIDFDDADSGAPNGSIAYNNGTNAMTFATSGNAERMRLSSAGELIIGNTNAGFSSGNRANITLNASASSIFVMQVNGGNDAYLYTDGANTYLSRIPANGNIFVTANAGGVYLSYGATSWTANSDLRLKNVTGNIENAVESLMTLKPIKHTWKSDNSNKEHLALIAQEVEKVFPQLIDKSKLNRGINTSTDGTEYLGVRYTELVPVLVKAIQELNEKIKTLENK